MGSEARGEDTLGALLEKATSDRLDLVRLPGRLSREKTIQVIAEASNTLARGDYDQAAKNAGLKHKDDFFKSSAYVAEVEALYRILNRIIKQIDPETGKPRQRSQEMTDFLASPGNFLDLRRPSLDERGSESRNQEIDVTCSRMPRR